LSAEPPSGRSDPPLHRIAHGALFVQGVSELAFPLEHSLPGCERTSYTSFTAAILASEPPLSGCACRDRDHQSVHEHVHELVRFAGLKVVEQRDDDGSEVRFETGYRV
jgi:hypothetical protein